MTMCYCSRGDTQDRSGHILQHHDESKDRKEGARAVRRTACLRAYNAYHPIIMILYSQ
jgi:hypothetical protein